MIDTRRGKPHRMYTANSLFMLYDVQHPLPENWWSSESLHKPPIPVNQTQALNFFLMERLWTTAQINRTPPPEITPQNDPPQVKNSRKTKRKTRRMQALQDALDAATDTTLETDSDTDTETSKIHNTYTLNDYLTTQQAFSADTE
jgi:hypothetical protein